MVNSFFLDSEVRSNDGAVKCGVALNGGVPSLLYRCRSGNGLVARPVRHVRAMDGYPILRNQKALLVPYIYARHCSNPGKCNKTY